MTSKEDTKRWHESIDKYQERIRRERRGDRILATIWIVLILFFFVLVCITAWKLRF